ncbi:MULTISPECIES: DUF4189 domain-containing protein [unclassified Rhizobium]|uniref:DUF4189 domain-containing protein n=1 Tax=unclassified Rhizobium TaxID=2613769 RepID=UPI001AD9EF1F|nr:MULTISPECIES: DUF4189 domain-containing protein [unclassified Rhizobium]MBO9098386.1 DUF4189 domain-containing protein [Rhizobium sp. L58/93]MBO9132810.1 DUF4189 domain-containing protein [Rhizobium sp. B209b/85]MBO9168652.1 DUF4189 domain-containing protein [Rhizobium sp. L245/93]MBO9184602.1 DUF4189 domain-containing protein [Rhizobium sp. E27B/91]QXZ84783.1 DUF4189 domain-containing protein [Rhizobium sp. K1/93]
MSYKAALGMSIALLLSVQASTAFAFGAFAVNDSKGTSASDVGYGTGWGSTRKEAERDAMKSCKEAGNDSCEIAVWFETCGAYVGDKVNYGIGYGDTKREAEKKALQDCPNCRVIVSDCQN